MKTLRQLELLGRLIHKMGSQHYCEMEKKLTAYTSTVEEEGAKVRHV
jgi:hypothetical protein